MSGFSWPARVYWEDTDGGGIVYYANYLRFLERARTEWLRQLGFSQQRLLREAGMVFTVVSLEIEYRAPGAARRRARVSCEPQPQGPASLRFAQRIYRRQAASGRASCWSRRACASPASMRGRCGRDACRRSWCRRWPWQADA